MEHETKRVKKISKNSVIIGGIALTIVLLLAVSFQISGIKTELKAINEKISTAARAQPTPTQAAQQRPTVPTPSPSIDMKSLVDDDDVKGDKNAPVTIVEFSDFECPFCTRFYKNTLPQIEEEYIKTGKVKFVYRDYPLGFHANAQKAAEATECAGEQKKFWEMHDKLFEEGVKGGVDSFKQFAVNIGLNTAKFNDCLDSGKTASEVKKDMVDGQQAGITGTPGFIINGRLVKGAQPFENFKQIIEAELTK